MRNKIALIFVMSLFSCASSAFNLEQAWQVAIQNNAEVSALGQERESAAMEVDAAKSAKLPEVSSSAAYTIWDHPSVSVRPGGIKMQVGNRQVATLGLNARYILYSGGAVENSIKSAEENYAATGDSISIWKSKLKLAVGEIYINILRAEKLLSVAQSHIEGLQSHYGDVQALRKQGMASKSDQLTVEVALANARQKKLQIENNLQQAFAALNYRLGKPQDKQYKLQQLQFAESATGLNEYIKKAVAERVEIEQLEKVGRGINYNADVVAASAKPNLFVGADYGYQENDYVEHEGRFSVSVGVSWKLFDGNQAKLKKAALLKKSMAVNDRIADVKNAIALEVRSAWLQKQDCRKRIEVTESAIELAQENLKNLRIKYKAGVATPSEVLDAETQLEESKTNYFNAVFDANLAELRLQYAVGAL
ncbi:MAG: TolC family protein [Gammaproteobacteria bacterium]|nr:MAG: TolC family protein [Gammaproteobacteria bacterium]